MEGTNAPMHIGYLGVGNMGQPMAGKLVDAGHQLTIHDISDPAKPKLTGQAWLGGVLGKAPKIRGRETSG